MILRQVQNPAAAESVLKKAVVVAEQSGDRFALGRTLHYWGLALREIHRYAMAEQAHLEAIRVLEQAVRDDTSCNVAAAQAIAALVIALLADERGDEAEIWVHKALALGRDDPYTGALLFNLQGELKYRKGRDAEAERAIQQAFQSHSGIQGSKPGGDVLAHTLSAEFSYPLLLAWIHNTSGLVAYRAARVKDAEASWRKSIKVYREIVPVGGVDVASPLANLSDLLRYKKSYREAVECATEALELYKQAFGSESARSGLALQLLAAIRVEMREYSEARTALHRALQIMKKQRGPRSSAVGLVMTGLAQVEAKEGKLIEAERLYREGIQLVEEPEGRDHPLLYTPLAGYATVLRKLKRREELKAVELRRVSIWTVTRAGSGTAVSVQGLRNESRK